ncbi:MAG: alpha/beta hydrolase [Chloroflexi bacterium]|nr:alpha/beta hydrolase [Chloroflexota bacterium]
MAATEKRVTMSHGETRYFEAGSGYPTILIHGAGFLSGADGWLPTMQPLAEQYRVLAIDCLNWGPGDVFNQEFSFPYLVDHVREFMDVLDIPRANIVGHSMGGWIATLFAYESPERVHKLILVAAGGAATRPLQRMVEFKVPDDQQITDQISLRLSKVDIDIEPILESYLDKAHDPEQVEAFAKVMRHMTDPLTRQRYNTLRRLPKITAPTLVLWGREDKTNALELGEQIHAALKGSKLVVIDDTGHGVPQEQPERFTKEVLAFLAE